jgi:hypothetical protein
LTGSIDIGLISGIQRGIKMNHFYRLLIFIFLTSINMASLNMVLAEETNLSRYIWQNRVILLFSPNIQDPRLGAQIKELQQFTCDIQDRDTLVFQIVKSFGVLYLNGSRSKIKEDNLRKKYRVQSKEYLFILIGKDGGEKLRSRKVMSVNEIFNEIDAMPMRQNEVAFKRKLCSS